MNQRHHHPPLNSTKTPSSTAVPDSPPQHISHRKDTVRERSEVESHDPTAARKVQKADREKIRRDRLNDQFHELGNTLDSDRPRNDKATIISETIQVLKDITAEVDKLKTEHKALSDESRELIQEKNELREEKASLKSDIENLNSQYQQRVRVMPPWTSMDHSVVMSSPYPYPVPMPIPPAPVSIHPHMQHFPYFGNPNPGHIPSLCSMYIPFSAPPNPPIEMPSAQYASTSHMLNRKELRSKSPGHRRPSDAKRCSVSPDVATELELKMPGSSTQQDSMSGGRKGKHSVMSDRIIIDESASSRYSPSQGPQDSFDSVGHTPKAVD
ncbi:transcription factor bHLH121 [Lathyrus oleraceus]|nr:transcription factor bHLH121-like [Pisum sativum]